MGHLRLTKPLQWPGAAANKRQVEVVLQQYPPGQKAGDV